MRLMHVRLLVADPDRSLHFYRTAHFRDPDGNLIEINSPLQQR